MRHRIWILPLLLTTLLSGCAAIDRLSGEGEAKRIRRVGRPADALVIGIQDTGMTLNDDPIVAFHLEVRPSSGAPYEVPSSATRPLAGSRSRPPRWS